MQSVIGFDLYTLNFDDQGALAAGSEFVELQQAARTATDAILIAHGFRNNVADAMDVYSGFLETFRGHLSRPEFDEISRRRYIVGAIFWPSKSLPETLGQNTGAAQALDADLPLIVLAEQKLAELKDAVPERAAELNQAVALLPLLDSDPDAQDKFTSLVFSVTDGSELDVTEGLPDIRQQKGSTILAKLVPPIILPTSKSSDGDLADSGSVRSAPFDGGVASIGSLFGSILGGVNKFLNLTTWYVMKNRSGVIGQTGVAQAVRDLQSANQSMNIHLVGHSLGGRLMAGCAKSLAQTPLLQPASLMLLEAAFSHYGFSANNGKGTPGFFRDVIARQVVKGPLVETFSFQDTVVGLDYAVASRLASDNTSAVGDADDLYGGIGRNGCQRTAESSFQPLKPCSGLSNPYIFRAGVVNCVDGSGGLIKEHGDVMNADVTYAFASAVAGTNGFGTILAAAAR